MLGVKLMVKSQNSSTQASSSDEDPMELDDMDGETSSESDLEEWANSSANSLAMYKKAITSLTQPVKEDGIIDKW